LLCDGRPRGSAATSGGNAAIEFAVIVPVMLTMFFGVVEFSSAVAVKRKISMAAEELADLAARYKEVPDTESTTSSRSPGR